ncbi:MAG: TetR/AcrR family transcriptional regulator C-terminal domain-containing protein [Corynebacterium sp.]|uniref:TetR family transcriptional regulator n=2 Tax=Corynebacterium stationis TaxID=1705 RepID=A0AB36CLD6_9CORY|nr:MULTISPECIES: TetR/AcrR family transcriptional regulator C-terminal domain-containing protein [Corynebacterium]NME89316.1 TetR family transcriptional regulator [Corynebacterium stationis]NWO15957.1 TetR/AcrR family transcriptional regulator C-terminal domain-containing protein [Corynebacterium sp.]
MSGTNKTSVNTYESAAPVSAAVSSSATEQNAKKFRRPRGHRAGLNIEKIVDAARALPQNQLSMQAVANSLGVDRKALNHYVHDRENLLSIVAAMEFTEAFEKLDIPEDADWRTVALAFAHSNAKGMLAAGLLSDYLRTGSNNAVPFLHASEMLLRSLTDAGLDLDTAIRSVAVINNACAAFTRDVVIARNSTAALRHELLEESLNDENRDIFPLLHEVAKLPILTTDDQQLDFAISVVLDGIEVLIDKHKAK